MDWLLANWKDLLDVVAYVVLAASVVAKLTPSVWDDKIVAQILRVLSLAPKNPANGKLVQK